MCRLVEAFNAVVRSVDSFCDGWVGEMLRRRSKSGGWATLAGFGRPWTSQ